MAGSRRDALGIDENYAADQRKELFQLIREIPGKPLRVKRPAGSAAPIVRGWQAPEALIVIGGVAAVGIGGLNYRRMRVSKRK